MRHPALAAVLTAGLLAIVLLIPVQPAHADAVIDWNLRANELVVESKLGTPPAMRAMAIVQTAVLEAVSVLAPRRLRRRRDRRARAARRSRSSCPRSRPRSSAPTRWRSARSRRRREGRRHRRGRACRRAGARRARGRRRVAPAPYRPHTTAPRLCPDRRPRRAAVGEPQALGNESTRRSSAPARRPRSRASAGCATTTK